MKMTKEQKQILIDEMDKHKSILFGNYHNSDITEILPLYSQRKQIWEKIANKLNSLSPDPNKRQKTITQWKKVNIKLSLVKNCFCL